MANQLIERPPLSPRQILANRRVSVVSGSTFEFCVFFGPSTDAELSFPTAAVGAIFLRTQSGNPATYLKMQFKSNLHKFAKIVLEFKRKWAKD
jgi:hypothetical protein